MINVKTYRMQALIKGSASLSPASQAFFLVKKGNNFEMHFTTYSLNNHTNKYESNWNYLHFKDDFVALITELGRLPFDSV